MLTLAATVGKYLGKARSGLGIGPFIILFSFFVMLLDKIYSRVQESWAKHFLVLVSGARLFKLGEKEIYVFIKIFSREGKINTGNRLTIFFMYLNFFFYTKYKLSSRCL